ncbi:hypothetical protein GCM10010345_90470 [Streptomyces canarius]|uniref:Uncharacterized protein n=1 Tax=Streptomyces canarius TaxID=285453 RepID=A0ABQ3DBT3_9ACTN|nr:hypothetical protein GCM10010345_90470 [Streptomyces canarius]
MVCVPVWTDRVDPYPGRPPHPGWRVRAGCPRRCPVAPIRDLRIEYSLLSRGPQESIIPTPRELGIDLTAYGVLSRGLLRRPLVVMATLDSER